MGSFIHVATHTGWGSCCVLISSINGSMKRGGIHFIMRACQTCMAFLAGLWFSGLFRIEGMGGMTAIAFVLDVMASLAECFLEGVGKGLVLRVVLQSVPGDRMPSHFELVIFS